MTSINIIILGKKSPPIFMVTTKKWSPIGLLWFHNRYLYWVVT